jgi:hypothetical protein
MQHIAGTGKQSCMNYNGGYALADGFVVLVEGLDTLRLVAITAVENEHVGQFLLHERKFD